jgi:hypothetical protein
MSKPVKGKPSKKVSADDDADFVPDSAVSEGGGGYFKPGAGKSKVRAISKPIVGWLAWNEDEEGKKTPQRTTDEPDGSDYEKDNKPKKFMTFVVINITDPTEPKVQVWEITQQSVIKAIKAYTSNPDWGKPFAYDLNIEKKGEGLTTKYTVTPSPKKPLSKELVKLAMEKPCNLDALMEGENPWEVEDDEATEYHLSSK